MSDLRVFELAKQLGISPGELMTRLRSMGVLVKSHSSPVSSAVAAQLTGTSMRVHEAAKELGVPAKELADRLESLGVSVKSHMSMVPPDAFARLIESHPPTALADGQPPGAPDEGSLEKDDDDGPPLTTESPPSPASDQPATSDPIAETQRPISIAELVDRADRLARLTPQPVEEASTKEADAPTPQQQEGARFERPRRATRLERIESAPGGRILLSLIAIAVVAGVLVSNLPRSYTGQVVRRSTGRALVNVGLFQGWNMFAPDPPLFNIRLVAVVRFTDGTRTTWSPPVENHITGGYRDFRWRRSDSVNKNDSRYYNGLADWLARKEGQLTGRRATQVIFYQAVGPSPAPGSTMKTKWRLVKIKTVQPLLEPAGT